MEMVSIFFVNEPVSQESRTFAVNASSQLKKASRFRGQCGVSLVMEGGLLAGASSAPVLRRVSSVLPGEG